MRRRIIWLVVSVLMVLSLVLASCAPKVTEEEEAAKEEVAKEEVVTEEKKVVTEEKKGVKEEVVGMVVDTLGRLVPEPQYGGIVSFGQTAPYREIWDEALQPAIRVSQFCGQTGNRLVEYDRLRGPAGTGEWTDAQTMQDLIPRAGGVLQSWELIAPDTMRFTVRQGIYWHDKAPAYGRELTPEDVEFALRRIYKNPPNMMTTGFGYLSDMKNPENSIYLDPDDPRTVVIKIQPGNMGNMFMRVGSNTLPVPVEQGMDQYVKRWQDIIGTGPFIMTDYVAGSSTTYQRNPNYWQKDPLHPENRLPYIDTFRHLIIPDATTMLAALRTGKIEAMTRGTVIREDVEGLARTNPEIMVYKYSRARSLALMMRHDVKPWDNVKVRQAMMMAIDNPGIIRDYYGGDADLPSWPGTPSSAQRGFYVPPEELPEIVQQMLGYHPDIAMKMLDEAGYPGPKRFTTSIAVSSAASTSAIDVDLLSIVVAQWAKVGVTLNIDIHEDVLHASIQGKKSYKDGMSYSSSYSDAIQFITFRKGSTYNYAFVDYPELFEATYTKVNETVFFEPDEKVFQILKEATPAMMEYAPYIGVAIPMDYEVWQPWLKGYYGEDRAMFLADGSWSRYVWIDRDLKQKITGRR